MNSIVIIIPYFGKLPTYFTIWLKSVEYNPTVDFKIYTDCKFEGVLPRNVQIVNITWEELRNKVKRVCGEDIVLHQPYKLCDYRPVYGEIFEEDIQGYTFWGHCDMDLVFGDIRSFLKDEILEKYDRILSRGHFCLYRNEKHVNLLYKETVKYSGINYRDAFSTKYSCHFDEAYNIRNVFETQTYDDICFADIAYQTFQFSLAQEIEGQNAKQIYKWNKGKLERYYLKNGNIKTDEFMYIHLQKRKMDSHITGEEDTFLIIPNEFCPNREITEEYILEHAKNSKEYMIEYYVKRLKTIWKNIISGALVMRIRRKIK